MALIDYERAWLALKAEIVRKPSHGQRDLLATMARVEVDSAVPEGQEGFDPAPPFKSVRRATTRRPRVGARHA